MNGKLKTLNSDSVQMFGFPSKHFCQHLKSLQWSFPIELVFGILNAFLPVDSQPFFQLQVLQD